MFVKGHLSFTLDQHSLEFVHQNISVYGVMGLPWGQLSPSAYAGRDVEVTIKIPADPALIIKSKAYIIRESTQYSETFGLKFNMNPDQALTLARHITKHGFYPTAYMRKYPRIPSLNTIQTFPLHVIIQPLNPKLQAQFQNISLTVANLSPNGILIASESPLVGTLHPGERIRLILEPRGAASKQITVEALICRSYDDTHTDSGNTLRFLGIKFIKVDEANRTSFLNMLKHILSQLSGTPQNKV
jgi:hypothetical protein